MAKCQIISNSGLYLASKQIIGVDFDDTIVDYMGIWLKVFNKETGKNASINEITKWKLFEIFSDVIDEDKMKELFAKAWKEEYENTKLVDPLLPKVFADLHKMFSIYVITASFASNAQITGLLEHNRIKYDKLIHVQHHTEKLSEEINIYVDDNPRAAEEFAENGKKVVLFDRPWNRDIKETDSIKRARSWKEVEMKIRGFASS